MLKSMISSIVSKNMKKKLNDATIKEEDLDEVLKQIRISLLDADVNLLVVKDFIKNVRSKTVGQVVDLNQKPDEIVLSIIREELIEILGSDTKQIDYSKKNLRIMMVGLQGSGKTTTAGKIALFLKNKYNKKPMLVACDIYRPAAIDQLKTLADQTKVDFFQKGNENPVKIAKAAIKISDEKDNDVIIFDTAGRLQTNEELMDELVKIKKETNPDEILLVVDSMAGQDVINVAKEFNNYLNLTGIVITKLDSDARAGAVLSLRSILNVPIKLTGTGEKLTSLDVFHPDRIADKILGYGDIMSLAEQASDVLDERTARKSLQKMLAGKMDLEDLLIQMEQLTKMGSFSSVLSMMPNIPNMSNLSEGKINEVETKIKNWKVMISSMTLKERRNPSLIKKNPNRKQRIIKGSGRKPDELNKMLSEWEKSKIKMEEVGKQLKKGVNPFSNFMK